MRASRSISARALGPEGAREIARSLPEEVAVAVTCNGSTQAVMMCSPTDLEDFARGFAFPLVLDFPLPLPAGRLPFPFPFGLGVEEVGRC